MHISRSLATVAEASTSTSSQAPPPSRTKTTTTETKAGAPILNTAVILNRSPIITRTPTPFERAYYAYQSRIKRALHTPFPVEFYFKQGSLLEGKFNKEEEEREREAFGSLRPSSSKVQAEEKNESSPAQQQSPDILGEEEDVQPMPRVSEADKTGDVKSLERKMERNLYLLLLGKDASGKQVWRFPQGPVETGELLHEAASRDLEAECGSGMDTWIVSRQPVGVYQSPKASQSYTFFYKGHILAGQAKPDNKSVADFAWLTKEEIKPKVDQDYWHGVKDMLSDF
ncbi:39S mitochondrial ribosomal protein L46-domain-containing protein [Abortiporus biennis]|nr:39S mitochondrial ribosomal protein L46-domain-containing protein [Abortiporus biennis]